MSTTREYVSHAGLTAEEHFWAQVNVSDGCWLWEGPVHSAGYGRFLGGDDQWLAHRWAFEYHHSLEIPSGLVLDHLCEVKLCVNPDHLEVVTQQENVRRYHAGGLTHAEWRQVYKLWVKNTWFTFFGAVAGWIAMVVIFLVWIL